MEKRFTYKDLERIRERHGLEISDMCNLLVISEPNYKRYRKGVNSSYQPITHLPKQMEILLSFVEKFGKIPLPKNIKLKPPAINKILEGYDKKKKTELLGLSGRILEQLFLGKSTNGKPLKGGLLPNRVSMILRYHEYSKNL